MVQSPWQGQEPRRRSRRSCGTTEGGALMWVHAWAPRDLPLLGISRKDHDFPRHSMSCATPALIPDVLGLVVSITGMQQASCQACLR